MASAAGLAGKQPVLPAAAVPFWKTRTCRGFFFAVLLMIALVGLFTLFGSLEAVFLRKTRVLKEPFALATHSVGLAHFVIAFLFQSTSRRMSNPRSRIHMVIAFLIGAGLCWLYAAGGGRTAYPRIPGMLLLAYFLVHALRDESFFYQQYKEARADADRTHIGFLLLGTMLFVLALVCGGLFLRQQETRDLVWLVERFQLSGSSLFLTWLIPTGILATAGGACFIHARKRSGVSLGRLFLRDRPLWVYACIPIVLLASRTIGGSGHSLVLLHVTGWWVFVTVTLARFGNKEGIRKLGLFGWLRQSQGGLQTLHIGLMLLVLGTTFLWIYRFGGALDTPVAWIAARDNFPYWTIVHITLSFVPKP